jgi:predicted TIM-barrel fold metal-dependent hydrolase
MTTMTGTPKQSARVDEDTAVMVFSADTHVGPRMQDLRPYCPQKYLSAFDDFAASSFAQAASNIEKHDFMYSDEYKHGHERNLATTGHYDPYARLRDMDRDGVCGAVIFHQSLNGEVFPFDLTNSFANGIPGPEARQLAGVGRRMYNRWLADFCSVQPERNVGLAQLPFWDLLGAIKELEWCAEHGLGGVNFPSPGQSGMVQPNEPEFDPFYAACASLDMTLATHIGAAPPRPRSPKSTDDPVVIDRPEIPRFGGLDNSDWGIRTVYMLCMFGVFERHPTLKLVLTEIPGVYWNEIALKMDSAYLAPLWRRDGMQPRPPSEYMATNVWMGNSFQSRQEAVAAIEIGRADRFLWGSDYPHVEGTFSYSEDPDEYPMTKLSLAFTYHDLPTDKVRKLVGENVLDAYPRLDGSALTKVAERVGLAVTEIATAPDLSRHAYVWKTGTLAFRTVGPWS